MVTICVSQSNQKKCYELATLVVIDTDFTGNNKSTYNTITTTSLRPLLMTKEIHLLWNVIMFDVSNVIVHLNEFHDVIKLFHPIIKLLVWSPLTSLTIISPLVSLIYLKIRNMKQNPRRYALISEIKKRL